MTSLFVPLMLVALGSAALVILRHSLAALSALAAQWVGLVWAGALLANTSVPGILGVNVASVVEFVTAVVCIVIFAVSVPRGRGFTTPEAPRPLADYLLASAAVLLGGIAGVGFALLFPLGGSEGGVGGLLFYWAVLGSALALVLDGTRNPVKLAAGLLGLLGAVAYLAITVSPTPLTSTFLALASLSRIALATMLAYGSALFVPLFGTFDLNVLFPGAADESLKATEPPKQLPAGPDPQLPIPGPQLPIPDPRSPTPDAHEGPADE